MARSFSIRGGGDANLTFTIGEPALRAQGLSLQTWTSSFVLAGLLHKLPVDFSSPTPVPVLELGAGTGLVGLAAAALWKVPVILTDLPAFVSGLAGNVNLNAATVNGFVRCGSLDWSQPDSLILQDGTRYEADKHQARIILAADTIYSEEHPELLARTILRWLAPGPTSRVILTYPLRVAYLDLLRELWSLLEAGGLEAIQDGQEQDDDVHDWDDECLCEWSVWRWKQVDGLIAQGNGNT
ncbi:hypothetical protein A1O7_05370 [Cladophialophora yegresii CBS 114405]|uniref:Glucose-inducible SAM-dependent methyltransferase Rrg1 n=1 Tax=Cladophialophora yegresii CBS 114405 TaxID=1182544 RepID=W9VQF8_9EURO|nr:uncharacterized protein A1O7_05370 [Cladophialophora yegresii CBS 114405]EXJ57947.1 hypothetical protein A1O7_05370 [Cladophialophora yegresii CBS 114405]